MKTPRANRVLPPWEHGIPSHAPHFAAGRVTNIVAYGQNSDNKISFDRIISIIFVGNERVYDISVEGTHNFIGNDIVAHNTDITGGIGAGVAETTNGNITGTGRLSITSTTATSTLSTGGLAVGTSQFVIQQTSGNVGIATTSPYGLLSIEQGTETNSLWVGNTGSSTPSFMVRGVNGNGNVGIGVTAPTFALDVRGSVYGLTSGNFVESAGSLTGSLIAESSFNGTGGN